MLKQGTQLKTAEDIINDFNIELAQLTDKVKQVRSIINFITIYGDCFGKKMIPIVNLGVSISKEIGFVPGEIICFYNLSFFSELTQGTANLNEIYSDEVLNDMLEKLKTDPELYAFGLNLISYSHWFRGEYEKGFDTIFECIKFTEENKVNSKGWHYFALAVYYFDTKDYSNSAIYYQKCLDNFEESDILYGKARSKNGLASIAIIENRTDDAISLLEYCIEVYRELGHFSGLSRALNDMGLLEKKLLNYSKAIENLNESIVLRKEINHIQGLITSYTELGEIYLIQKEYNLALKQFEEGLFLAQEVQTLQKQMRLHKLLYDSFKELNNTELALEHLEKFYEIKSKLLSDEASNNIKRLQTNYEKEKSEKETELERFKNIELKSANDIIEQKNKDITDSINYAKRIQLSILPPKDVLDKCFENYFVFYKPKDIVSGDFYWAVSSTNRQTNEKLSIIAAVDCTGHGVPGAFMSMLGNTLLNQTILHPKIISPSDVLNYLNQKLAENLKSSDQEQNIRDGMDMSLCIFNFEKLEMQFSGANNPCWIIRNNELIELKGDKQAISACQDLDKKSFTNHVFEIQKGDCIYIFTDGFPDQFGGPKGKKFTYKRFKEILLENYLENMTAQKEKLNLIFEEWKADLEQIDDVCVIGIRV